MSNTAPLPRDGHRDRRTRAQRMARIALVARYRAQDGTVHDADIAVGAGGWPGDVQNALARLGIEDVIVIAVGPFLPAYRG